MLLWYCNSLESVCLNTRLYFSIEFKMRLLDGVSDMLMRHMY